MKYWWRLMILILIRNMSVASTAAFWKTKIRIDN